MRFGGAGANDKIIRERGDITEINDDNVLRFFVGGKLRTMFG
jgi:hypothetical protein